MPSWAGTGMVTICTFTRRIRSMTGISTTTPGWRTSSRTRPKRKTTPRWNCCTTRTLTAAHAAVSAAAPASAPSTASTIIAVTSAAPGSGYPRYSAHWAESGLDP
ncbi:hypothetical protein GCM10009665_61220 [Kitasatospora nipponensis]|uniref:Uncharacterized protein n=1 Tax=Kitasatospora nipponensis TaxID=258049 RepID=A0ABN1WW23_9ACTN